MSICSKLGPNLSEMEFRIFLRIQKVIWDHFVASKAEIIQTVSLILELERDAPSRFLFVLFSSVACRGHFFI